MDQQVLCGHAITLPICIKHFPLRERSETVGIRRSVMIFGVRVELFQHSVDEKPFSNYSCV